MLTYADFYVFADWKFREVLSIWASCSFQAIDRTFIPSCKPSQWTSGQFLINFPANLIHFVDTHRLAIPFSPIRMLRIAEVLSICSVDLSPVSGMLFLIMSLGVFHFNFEGKSDLVDSARHCCNWFLTPNLIHVLVIRHIRVFSRR